MGVKFLSDEWFEQAEAAKASIENFEVPAELKDAVINVTATGDDGEIQCCMNGGVFHKGHVDEAPATLILPKSLAFSVFIENDQAAGMQGFMSGELRVEGDMSAIMSLQSVEPTESQKAYQAKIQGFTEQ